MRVLYVIDGLGPGGAERSLAEITPHLVRLGVNFHVAVLHDRDGFADHVVGGGATLHSLAETPTRRSWFGQLVRLVGGLRPDLVHTTLFDSDVLGRVAAAARRRPVVSSLVNVQYGEEQREEFAGSQGRLRAAQVVDIATARLVRRFHAVSTPVADVMASRLHVRRARIDVVPRGRDRVLLGESTAARRHAARTSLGLDHSSPIVLCVARQDHAKGLDVLLRAWAKVHAEIDDGCLLIAGREGTRSEDLRRLLGELGLGRDVVRLLGVRDDVPDLLCAADAFVLPSRREGLPGALLEAMALSVPIVATRIDATLDAVPSDEYATLVPVDDPSALAGALLTILRDAGLARARASASRTRFDERFSIESVAGQMLSFYERALA